jgi:rhodanese-related sulfurtransferase/rubrerythrin
LILGSFYQPVKSISADEVRAIVKKKRAEEYFLLDVRQPNEYSERHLPGATLIPLSDLPSRIDSIDSTKPVIVYCRSGNRSRSAVGILNGAGREDVFNMDGGILAYDGIVASGPPEAGVFCFPESLSPDQLVAMAWYVEDGSQKFCEELAQEKCSMKMNDLPINLIHSKKEQKRELVKLYQSIVKPEERKEFPSEVLPSPPVNVMAGCIDVNQAIEWSKGNSISDILDLMISLEANTFDLFLKLGRQVESHQARKVFVELAEKEKIQLKALISAFEKNF